MPSLQNFPFQYTQIFFFFFLFILYMSQLILSFTSGKHEIFVHIFKKFLIKVLKYVWLESAGLLSCLIQAQTFGNKKPKVSKYVDKQSIEVQNFN